jgi:hypothetical protein
VGGVSREIVDKKGERELSTVLLQVEDVPLAVAVAVAVAQEVVVASPLAMTLLLDAAVMLIEAVAEGWPAEQWQQQC